MKRALRLNKETLTTLSTEAMSTVVGGAPTHKGCTLPINGCLLSLDDCQSDDCGTGTIVIVISGGC